MPDIVKKYLDKIKEFWNKYSKKQKTIFISSVLVAVIAIAILGFVLAQPQTVVVRYCSTASLSAMRRERHTILVLVPTRIYRNTQKKRCVTDL